MAPPASSPPPGVLPPTPIPAPPAGPAPPASTIRSTVDAVSPPPQTPVSPSSLSPVAAPFRPSGRSKEVRWKDSSPPSSPSEPRTFKHVVVASLSSAAREPPRPPPVEHRPRIVLPSEFIRPLRCPGGDPDRWTEVVSRATLKARSRLHQPPRRPVPVDLRGLCFNCFSSSHRAAACRSRPRCFRCRLIGHRSFACLARRTGAQMATADSFGQTSVWRRIAPAAIPAATVEVPPSLAIVRTCVDARYCGRRALSPSPAATASSSQVEPLRREFPVR